MIKYLLNELYTYEGDHCDALNPFDSLDSVVRQAGEKGEVNPMCSLELRSRLDELQMQNERRYEDLSHRVNKLLHSVQDRSHALSNQSQHSSAEPSHRYHPYSQALRLTGPGIV